MNVRKLKRIYFKQLFISLFVAMIMLTFNMPIKVFAAGSASFSISPASGSYYVGDNINFSISETSSASDNVDAVETDLTYNASQLQYVSTTLTGPFTICAKNSGGGGSVNIACASSSTVSGTQNIATVTFKVLATGTASISMAQTSDIDNTGGTSVWNGTLPSPASYSLSSSSSSSSSSSGSGSSGSSSTICTKQAPSIAPILYEIDATDTTATLYFSPAGSPYDNHFISYGQGTNSEGYGITFSTGFTSGALYYTVRSLAPGTTYTFKVRGGNGCMPGPWSGTMTIQTLTNGSGYTKQYFPNQQAQSTTSSYSNWFTQAVNTVKSIFPGPPDTGLAAPKKHMKVTPAISPHIATLHTHNTHSSSPSLWSSITNFISGIFHAL